MLHTLLAALLACLSGCASVGESGFASRDDQGAPAAAPNPNGGHLVIVGGGLKDDNAPVHERFVRLCAGGPIGIVPIASGGGLSAGASSADDWRLFAGKREVIVIPLTKDSRNADDAQIARQISECGGLWFTGGDQSRVTAVLKPGGRETECLKACFAVLARGGVIGGTSAGAAIMTDPMITGGQSPGRLFRDPDETASPVRTAPGLGFLSIGLTDQHFLERGRMGRLIAALHERSIPIGFGIRENCALIVDREHDRAEAIGDRAVCILAPIHRPVEEASGATQCASLSVLSTGDTLTFGHGSFDPRSIIPDHGLSTPAVEPRPRSSHAAATRHLRDPWDMATVENALDRLESDPAQLTLEGDRASIEFGGLSASRTFIDPAHRRHACLVNVQVCVRLDPSIAPAR
jgi:cyanophycinase